MCSGHLMHVLFQQVNKMIWDRELEIQNNRKTVVIDIVSIFALDFERSSPLYNNNNNINDN